MLVLLVTRTAEGLVTPRPVKEQIGETEYALGALEFSCRTAEGADCMDVV